VQRANGKYRQMGIALGVAAVFAVILLRGILLRLLTQVALAYLLMALALPLSKRIEKRLSGGLSATLALAAQSIGLGLGLFLLVPFVIKQGRELAQLLPYLAERGQALFDTASAFLTDKGIVLFEENDLSAKMNTFIGQAFPMVLEKAGSLSLLFPVPILAFYFLKDRESIACYLSMWVPLKYRQKAVAAAREMRRELSCFFRGQLLVSLAVGALTALGLLLIGAPAWFLLGILMGLLELIPYLGPILGTVPVVLFTLPSGMGKALWALAVVVVVQQAEGSVISPKLMAGATDLHPVTVLLAVSLGSMAAGVAGMLVALPLVVSLRGAMRVLRLKS
jgi:Predicted permease